LLVAEARVTGASRDRLLLVAAYTAGILYRIVPYARRPSLWLDEACLALGIAGRSFAGLLRPLDYDQAAPPLFLWAEKLAMLVGGANEYALRALPLIAGLLVPTLTYALAVRIVQWREAMLAAALAALSPLLVQYSVQLKPYEIDALVCLTLLTMFLSESSRERSGRPGPWTTGLGVVAVWLSTTAAFVLAAIAAASWFVAPRTKRIYLAGIVGLWGVSFAVAYWGVYRPVAANPYLHWFWHERLLTPWVPGLAARAYGGIREVVFNSVVANVIEVGQTRLADACILGVVAVTGTLALLGAWRLARTRRLGLVLICGPLAAALLASSIGAYPIAPRLMLFGVPLLVILVAVGVVHFLALPGRWPSMAGAMLLGPIFVAGQLRNVVRADDPYRERDIRPGIELLERNMRPGEAIYVSAGALPAWTFYTTDWSRPNGTRLARMAREGSSGGRAFENGPSRGGPVVEEGVDLVFPFRTGVELLGVTEGAPLRIGHEQRPAPDSGWAESEARRIQQAAHPTAWVIATTSFGTEQLLEHAVRALGGIRLRSLARPGVVVTQYHFPVDPRPTR